MDPLSVSVARRFVVADAVGDPKSLLVQFEEEVKKAEAMYPPGAYAIALKMKEQSSEIVKQTGRFSSKDIPGYEEMAKFAQICRARIPIVSQWASVYGDKLFLSIIQQYVLPPALRKKVEMAARTYSKSRHSVRRKLPGQEFEYIGDFEKLVKVLRLHVDVAKDALAKGKEHVEGDDAATKVNVGAFTLVNTGGFDPKVMDTVTSVVKKASEYVKSSGLGKVLYGDILVTNTIMKNSRVLAFYMVTNDEMFIRANVKASIDTIQTVLHELGHRYEAKFLKDKRGVDRLYRLIDGQESARERSIQKSLKAPEVGETVVIKGDLYRVRAVTWGRGGEKVVLEDPDNPKETASISLEGYLSYKGGAPNRARNFDEDPNYKGFVTDYARKTPSENFAEMFAFYCMGRLPVMQSVAFEELVFGASKTAQALRLARRFREVSTDAKWEKGVAPSRVLKGEASHGAILEDSNEPRPIV